MRVRKHIFFSGQVQGVGFRYTATHLAHPLDLTGGVKNLRDGRVEMEVQGRPEAIEQLLSQLRNQRFIVIEDVEIREMPVAEETGKVVSLNQNSCPTTDISSMIRQLFPSIYGCRRTLTYPCGIIRLFPSIVSCRRGCYARLGEVV